MYGINVFLRDVSTKYLTNDRWQFFCAVEFQSLDFYRLAVVGPISRFKLASQQPASTSECRALSSFALIFHPSALKILYSELYLFLYQITP